VVVAGGVVGVGCLRCGWWCGVVGCVVAVGVVVDVVVVVGVGVGVGGVLVVGVFVSCVVLVVGVGMVVVVVNNVLDVGVGVYGSTNMACFNTLHIHKREHGATNMINLGSNKSLCI
jgi:hypothetical protein